MKVYVVHGLAGDSVMVLSDTANMLPFSMGLKFTEQFPEDTNSLIAQNPILQQQLQEIFQSTLAAFGIHIRPGPPPSEASSPEEAAMMMMSVPGGTVEAAETPAPSIIV
jgi:hypothetical protein